MNDSTSDKNTANPLIDEKRALAEKRKKEKLERKMRKKALGANQRDESKWPKCLFWIAKCSRFCSGERVPNSKYCINHIHMDKEGNGNTKKGERRRVVCPIDPSHTVYEDKLEKHIRICNKSKKEAEKQRCPYFVPDINCGKSKISEAKVFSTDEDKKTFELSLEAKIRSIYSSIFPNGIKTDILRPDEFEPFIADKATKGATQDSLRHLYQQVSMICHMQKKGMMQDNPVYVEFGAGRGMLSLGIDYCLNKHLPSDASDHTNDRGKYLLIDMSSVRFKADRWMRHKESNFERITGNIRDIDLCQVPIFQSIENRQFVGIAKHLCGVATDYTIRCILNSIHKEEDRNSLECVGVCIATCCHHRCQWHSFVGQDYYKQLGLKEEEWDYVRRLTSWATLNSKDHSSEEREDTKKEDSQVKLVNKDTLTYNTVTIDYIKLNLLDCVMCRMDVMLGRMCKRIIDYCRSRYIEEHINMILKEKGVVDKHFRSELVYYCDPEDSPENCIILGSIY